MDSIARSAREEPWPQPSRHNTQSQTMSSSTSSLVRPSVAQQPTFSKSSFKVGHGKHGKGGKRRKSVRSRESSISDVRSLSEASSTASRDTHGRRRRHKHKRRSSRRSSEEEEDDEDDEEEDLAELNNDAVDEEEEEEEEDRELTLKDRQDKINRSHPFGLPIWKPALYKKSRSVVRDADVALHSSPSSSPDMYLYPGNIFWMLVFGWWMCAVILIVSFVLYLIPPNGYKYARVVRELAIYLLWPFGRYVEKRDKVRADGELSRESTNGRGYGSIEEASLEDLPAVQSGSHRSIWQTIKELGIGGIAYYLLFYTVIAPVQLLVSALCWLCVVSIPMAKLNYVLVSHLRRHPLSLHFKSNSSLMPSYSSSSERVSILLCTYQAIGFQYYKYTYDGVNIMFINTLPVVFFVIISQWYLKDWKAISFLTSPGVAFVLGLVSVMPLSYFIGMAVSSISAQSSMGIGAVINATFGSIIEIILYTVALKEGKGRLVEGSLIGSFLAGVLLMPGSSMISGGWRRKEQKFNAKSAGVTSTMLIMAIIGCLTPTMYWNIYGSFELICTGCPTPSDEPREPNGKPWACNNCYYGQPNMLSDIVYQNHVKPLMTLCAILLPLGYLTGLWFSLHTHVKQIWQAPHPHHDQAAAVSAYNKFISNHMLANMLATNQDATSDTRAQGIPTPPNPSQISVMTPGGTMHIGSPILHGPFAHFSPHQPSPLTDPNQASSPQEPLSGSPSQSAHGDSRPPNAMPAYAGFGVIQGSPSYLTSPFTESANQQAQQSSANDNSPKPTGDDADKPSIYQHGRHASESQPLLTAPLIPVMHFPHPETDAGHTEEEAGGHDSPNWTKSKSAVVLLACTVLYSLISEILIDTVDSVMDNVALDEKFLGLTLFALVPNITEFMNAILFALYGNIVLSLEIGSAYALQVCLIQIPAMIGISAFFNWNRPIEDGRFSFNLVFPRWDLFCVVFSVFLLTHTYQEGKSNYFKGSILILSYLIFMGGFYFMPTGTGVGL
ncbi:hypothetical protein BZG36_02572 [Bifiguratus adelaidae]|uniref:Sodium/calcium exchanger membrane region domain-containing protein n=1 Tax=Bifiguratus adelaidae TaxID=1938954 RepID=A0A261Y108_9FUNG|nr:hypothetical protein BZG36_02572 [Bifiguratus adelaidae]